MRFIIISIIAAFISTMAMADTWVNGYTRSDGTHVQGHWRSSPDSSHNNNWSTKGTQTPIPAKKAQSHVPMMAICQNKTMAFA